MPTLGWPETWEWDGISLAAKEGGDERGLNVSVLIWKLQLYCKAL